MEDKNSEIVHALEVKAGTKQMIYRKTLDIFSVFKTQISTIASEIAPQIRALDRNIEVSYKEAGDFEAQLKFSGDTLLFLAHTNVFNFPPDHFIFKSDYIHQDPMRAYCGMIMIYDFLSDSIKYNRTNDVGYLIARIFINKDGHFFIQGKRQFSCLYNNFSEYEINPEAVRLIVQDWKETWI